VHASKEHQMCWESSRIRCQMSMEDSFCAIARSSGKNTVVICDRGTMDAAAYMAPETWKELLAIQGWTEKQLRDDRYDLILHMVSTAIGAVSFYTKSNNAARRETVAEAAALDERIKGVWSEHKHVIVVDNSTNFSGKIVRVVAAIANHLGMLSPCPTGSWHRFLIAPDKVAEALAAAREANTNVEDFVVTYTFLSGSSEEENQCVRKRVQGHNATYSLARKFRQHRPPTSDDGTTTTTTMTTMTADPPTVQQQESESTIIERTITAKEYHSLLRQAEPSMRPLTRVRHTFIYGERYFELDEHSSGMVLQVEVCDNTSALKLPPWIEPHVTKDITSDSTFSLYKIAQKYSKSND